MSLITEITKGLDALSISPFLVIDDNVEYEKSWGFHNDLVSISMLQ